MSARVLPLIGGAAVAGGITARLVAGGASWASTACWLIAIAAFVGLIVTRDRSGDGVRSDHA